MVGTLLDIRAIKLWAKDPRNRLKKAFRSQI